MLVLFQKRWMRRRNHLLRSQPKMRKTRKLLRTLNCPEKLSRADQGLGTSGFGNKRARKSTLRFSNFKRDLESRSQSTNSLAPSFRKSAASVSMARWLAWADA